MTGKEWRILREQTVFDERPFVQVVRQSVTTTSGELIDDFFQVLLRPFAICIPVTADGTIIALRQYKHGPRRVCLTFPAGFCDPGEAASEACRRELLEETGFQPSELIHLGEFVDNGNQRGCIGNYYLAKGCERIAEPDSGDHEEAEILMLPPDEIDRLLDDGEIAVTHNAMAWLLARRHGF